MIENISSRKQNQVNRLQTFIEGRKKYGFKNNAPDCGE